MIFKLAKCLLFQHFIIPHSMDFVVNFFCYILLKQKILLNLQKFIAFIPVICIIYENIKYGTYSM